jgi:hypothetical protein
MPEFAYQMWKYAKLSYEIKNDQNVNECVKTGCKFAPGKTEFTTFNLDKDLLNEGKANLAIKYHGCKTSRTDDKNRLVYACIRNDQSLVVGIRGTEPPSKKNWKVNLNALWHHRLGHLHAHSGFVKFAIRIWGKPHNIPNDSEYNTLSTGEDQIGSYIRY